MQVLREIRTSESSSLILDLPKEFAKRKLEVIILPLEKIKKRKRTSFHRFLKNPFMIGNFRMPSREERNNGVRHAILQYKFESEGLVSKVAHI